jgi:NAD(P)-dependent dehydrogenase (short-subunit alcohol dehydrogenase family)
VSSLGTVDENAQRALTRIPIGRMGTVTDIAQGIVFLASDDAAFMTGAGLVIDGGISGIRLAVGAKGNRTLDLSYVVGALCH